MIKASYTLLRCKIVTLFALAGFSGLFTFFSRSALDIFVVVAVAALTAAELYAERSFHPTAPSDATSPERKQPELFQ